MAQASTLDPAYRSIMDHDSSPYCTPLTLPCRHLALLYISQPSGYLVALVLTWLPSHTFCAITSWILPIHPLCVTALQLPLCSFLESLRALFTEHPLST